MSKTITATIELSKPGDLIFLNGISLYEACDIIDEDGKGFKMIPDISVKRFHSGFGLALSNKNLNHVAFSVLGSMISKLNPGPPKFKRKYYIHPIEVTEGYYFLCEEKILIWMRGYRQL